MPDRANRPLVWLAATAVAMAGISSGIIGYMLAVQHAVAKDHVGAIACICASVLGLAASILGAIAACEVAKREREDA